MKIPKITLLLLILGCSSYSGNLDNFYSIYEEKCNNNKDCALKNIYQKLDKDLSENANSMKVAEDYFLLINLYDPYVIKQGDYKQDDNPDAIKKSYKKMIDYYKKIINIYEKLLGSSHPKTAVAYNDLARTYISIDNYQLANKYFLKVLDCNLDMLPQYRLSLNVYYSDMAYTYKKLKKYDKALYYYDKAKKALLKDKANLNLLYDLMGTYERKARILQIEAKREQTIDNWNKVRVLSNIIGSKHHEGIACLNLAYVYENLEKYTMALKYRLEYIALEKSLSRTLLVIQYEAIADLYKKLDKFQEAYDYYQKTLKISTFNEHKINLRKKIRALQGITNNKKDIK